MIICFCAADFDDVALEDGVFVGDDGKGFLGWSVKVAVVEQFFCELEIGFADAELPLVALFSDFERAGTLGIVLLQCMDDFLQIAGGCDAGHF